VVLLGSEVTGRPWAHDVRFDLRPWSRSSGNAGQRQRSICPTSFIREPSKRRRSGTSKAEVIHTAVRHELLGASADQQERARRRARLLAAMGKLDGTVYPVGHLDDLRAEWRD
jgi:hypothetical protein